jgi:hypothetical protein
MTTGDIAVKNPPAVHIDVPLADSTAPTKVRWKIFPDDAVPHLDQLHRPRLAVGGDAADRQGVRHRPGHAGPAAVLLLLDLRLHADPRRHAGRPLRPAQRDRRATWAGASSRPSPPSVPAG